MLFLWRSLGAYCNKCTKRKKNCAVLCLSEICRNDSQRQISGTEKKGYCFQCLFPRASPDKRKHRDGMCQRDFVCKHKSHDKYPIKKHVLVCHERRNDTENQELLQKYKDRFIMKQPNQLPSFSRDLKLSFHMNQKQSPNFQDISDQRKAIYILRAIKVEQHKYSPFCDTGCCDMV